MSYHDISVDGDGQDVEYRDTKQPIAEERIQLTKLWSPYPASGEKHRGCKGKVEASEEKVRN